MIPDNIGCAPPSSARITCYWRCGVLADPADQADITAANTLQDKITLEAGAARPFSMPGYDKTSFDATRNALLQLAEGLPSMAHAFGSRDEVDPVRHLIAPAAAWGGLPDAAAQYLNVDPGLPVGAYRLTVRDVPCSRTPRDMALAPIRQS